MPACADIIPSSNDKHRRTENTLNVKFKQTHVRYV